MILTDLRGRIGGTLVKLLKRPDCTAIGRFLPECASFMWLRHTLVPDPPVEAIPDMTSQPIVRTTTVDPKVMEAGPQPVWEIIEDCHALWRKLGEPSWDRFGLTATPGGQHVWFDTPDSARSWQLPNPSDPAPAEASRPPPTTSRS